MDAKQHGKPKTSEKVKTGNPPDNLDRTVPASPLPAKTPRKRGPRQGKNSNATPPPIKVEVSEPKHKMLFGPKPTFEGELEDSGTVAIILAVNAYLGRVRSALLGLVAHCAQHTSNNSSYINAAYAYKFLYEYVVKCWMRQVPTYRLEHAPPVYWDICDAGTPKSAGHVQFSVGTVDASTAVNPSSANTANVALGTTTYDTTSKYVFVDSSLSAYTEALGVAAATALFQGVAGSLKVVKREAYKAKILSNDTSIFCLANDPSGINGIYSGGDGTTHFVDGTVRHGGKLSCKWLYHLSICNLGLGNGANSHPYASAPAHEIYSPPAAIVVHRLMNGMSGYEGENQRVILKPVFIQDYVYIFDQMWGLVDKQFDPTGTNHIFKTAGSMLGIDDVVYVLQLVLGRQFAGWSSVAAGWMPTATSRALSVGTAAIPSRGYGSVMFPKVLTDMLARLKPFKKDQTSSLGCHIHYYPILCTYTTGVPVSAALYGTTGFLSGVWNFITNLVGTGDVAAAMDSSNWTSLMAGWQGAMRVAASFWDMAAPHSHSPVNFCCLSRIILNSNYLNGVQGTASDRKVGEDVGFLVDRTILPTYLVQDPATANQIRYLHGQGIYEAQTDQATSQRDLVLMSIVPSVHPLDGSSSDYIRNNSENKNGSLVGTIASAALGGAVSQGVSHLANRFAASAPELAANAAIGYGFYSRFRGSPSAFSLV